MPDKPYEPWKPEPYKAPEPKVEPVKQPAKAEKAATKKAEKAEKEAQKPQKAQKAPPVPAEDIPLDIGTGHNQRTTLPPTHSRDGDPALTAELIEEQNQAAMKAVEDAKSNPDPDKAPA